MISRHKTLLFENHPLNNEEPEEWNNVAIPIKKAIRNIIQTILAMDESNFDYQMKANERLFKLQE
jgi:hypothetical protein